MDTLLPLLLIFGLVVAYVKRCEDPFSQLGLCEEGKDKKKDGEAGATEGEAPAASCEGMKGKEKKECEKAAGGEAAPAEEDKKKKKGGKKKSNYANSYFSDSRSYYTHGRISYG